MIDPVAVEEVGVAVGPIAQPVEIAFGEHLPPVDGKSPVLTGVAEGVRRNADGITEALERVPGRTIVCLETTAGSGTAR